MSRSELVKKSKRLKTATVALGIASVVSFVFVHWLLGTFLAVATGYVFFKTLKACADSGMRF